MVPFSTWSFSQKVLIQKDTRPTFVSLPRSQRLQKAVPQSLVTPKQILPQISLCHFKLFTQLQTLFSFRFELLHSQKGLLFFLLLLLTKVLRYGARAVSHNRYESITYYMLGPWLWCCSGKMYGFCSCHVYICTHLITSKIHYSVCLFVCF